MPIISAMYSLYDWISAPTPGQHQCCQCISLRTKKTILLFTLMALVLTSAILVYILIGAFAIPMPQFVNGILFIIEFGACLLLIVALSSERWHFVVPLIAAEVLRLAVWGAYIVYYIVLIIQNKSQGNGGDITVASIVVPGAPSVGLGNAGGKPMSNDIYTKTVGHVLLMVAVHIILLWIAISIYRVYRYKRIDLPKEHARFMPSAIVTHNVIVLEQPIEEAMYGKKRTAL
uniref:MARVEL domain-containing protein n=1 Tax=Parascaris univalens TaxID=6257 RepID=A0A915BWT9_PARUN